MTSMKVPSRVTAIASLAVLLLTTGCGTVHQTTSTGAGSGGELSPLPNQPAGGSDLPVTGGGVVGTPILGTGIKPPDVPLRKLPVAPLRGPRGVAGKLVTVAWQKLGVTDGGRRVAIRYGSGGCTRPDHVTVVQRANRVVIGVVLRDTSRAGQPCPMYMRVVEQNVVLSAPLGGRKLVHAPISGYSRGTTGCTAATTCTSPKPAPQPTPMPAPGTTSGGPGATGNGAVVGSVGSGPAKTSH
jgi:hypothetical protein